MDCEEGRRRRGRSASAAWPFVSLCFRKGVKSSVQMHLHSHKKTKVWEFGEHSNWNEEKALTEPGDGEGLGVSQAEYFDPFIDPFRSNQ